MQPLNMTDIEEVSGGRSIFMDIAIGLIGSAAWDLAKGVVGSQMQGGGDLEAATAGQLGA